MGRISMAVSGKEGYQQIAESDIQKVAPARELTNLFKKYGPCLILIDNKKVMQKSCK